LLMLIVVNMMKGPAAEEAELIANPISPPAPENETVATSPVDAVAHEVSFPEANSPEVAKASDELQLGHDPDVAASRDTGTGDDAASQASFPEAHSPEVAEASDALQADPNLEVDKA